MRTKNVLLCIAIGLLLGYMITINYLLFLDNKHYHQLQELENSIDEIEIIQFDTMQPTIANALIVCDSIGIKHPTIVVAQAVLESGNFTSHIFKKYNNPLGLYDSKNKKYHSFNHWTESFYAYQNMIEYRYDDKEQYYNFLHRIQYAKDKQYIYKLKQIEKGLNNE